MVCRASKTFDRRGPPSVEGQTDRSLIKSNECEHQQPNKKENRNWRRKIQARRNRGAVDSFGDRKSSHHNFTNRKRKPPSINTKLQETWQLNCENLRWPSPSFSVEVSEREKPSCCWVLSSCRVLYLPNFDCLSPAVMKASCVFTVNFTHPIETVKTRMQISGNGMGLVIRNTFTNEGVGSFWKGIVWAWGREGSYASIKLGAYAPVRDAIGAGGKDGTFPLRCHRARSNCQKLTGVIPHSTVNQPRSISSSQPGPLLVV